ncbi:MAG: hypothetical protein NXI31_19505 [bacterium]|nr:hypothetical protein [bacterium]
MRPSLSARRGLTVAAALATALAVPAQFLPYGSGCAAGVVPTLAPATGARLAAGLPFALECHDTPAGAPGILAFSLTEHPSGLSLAPYGFPGCRLYNQADISLLMLSGGTSTSATIPLPDFPCRLSIYAQAAIIDGTSPGGLSWSNGAELALDGTTETFVHRATTANITSNWTTLDHPDLNDEPGAVFLVQPRATLSSTGSDIGVWYNLLSDRWTIFHQDQSPMAIDENFLVVLPNSGAVQFQHHHAGGSSPHISRLDHPSLNGNPNAVVHATKLYPNNSNAYLAAPIGVYYDGLRWNVFTQDFTPMPANIGFQIVVADEHLKGVENSFVHVVTSIVNNRLSSPDLNNNAGAALLATQVWRGTYNPSLVTFHYDWLHSQQWDIQNRSGPFPVGAEINVLQVDTVPRGHAQQYVSNNTSATIQLPVSADPVARLLVGSVWNPPGHAGTYNNNELALGFNQFASEFWYVTTEGSGNQLAGSGLNLIYPNRAADFVAHVTSSANTSGDTTTLDDPALNGDPNAVPFLQPITGVTNDHPAGLQYSNALGRWQVRNLDGAAIPTGKRFHVLAGNSKIAGELTFFRHQVTAANLGASAHVSYLDHPELNGRHSALAVLTRRSGGGIPANPNPIGIYYDLGLQRWAVFNQNLAPLPIGTELHVLVDRACR